MTTASERSFTTFDGSDLFYRAWLPEGRPQGAIFLCHRGHEHSGRLIEFVETLNLPQFAIFAWDARGHGRSPGERGYARHFTDLARDLDCFVRIVASEHRIAIEDMLIVAHSVAAVVAATWVHDYAPRIRGLVLATPAFQVKLYVPGALAGLRILQRVTELRGTTQKYIKSYVSGKLLTHDPFEAQSYDNDALVSKQIASNILIDLFDTSKRLLADAGALVVPTLLLSARADWVVKNKPQRDFLRRMSSNWKETEVYKDFFHSIFHEKERQLPIAAVRRFILEVFQLPVDRSELLAADLRGYTKEEYQWLSAGLPMISAKRLVYKLQSFLMKTLGKLSQGVRIGWETGFDSGQSLDYVYQNIANGSGRFGRLVDRNYLDSVGWKGIRQRRVHLEQLIEIAIRARASERQVSSEQPIQLFDLAGGPGRYVISVLQKLNAEYPLRATIRDWSEAGLEVGRNIASGMGVNNVQHLRGDAFDPVSLAELPKSSDIGIISGLFELFPDNQPIRTALRGVHDALAENAALVYTNQPWHPQLEMIAEVLLNREGKPWVMRRRTQAEMDELVSAAGFVKEQTLVDDEGIFTVSIARRV